MMAMPLPFSWGFVILLVIMGCFAQREFDTPFGFDIAFS